MKRTIISLVTVVMLVMMMLPTDIAMARGPGAGGQTATNETATNVTIESPLVADFIFYIPACSSCSGITFTDKSTGGVKPYKYNWDFGDGSKHSSAQNPRHRYASSGNYTVTLTVTDRAGDVASESETITLNLDSGISPTGRNLFGPQWNDSSTADNTTTTLNSMALPAMSPSLVAATPPNPPYLDVAKSASPGPGCLEASVTLNVTGAGNQTAQRLPVDIMLILDCSGSMGSGGKLTAAQTAARTFIGSLNSSIDRVGLVSYSDSATLNRGLTSNFAAVNTTINGLSASGHTDIGDAIKTANTELTTHGRSPGVVWVEILLTDGLPNRPYGTSNSFTESDAEYARGFAQAAHAANITLYTIGLGSSTDATSGISYYFLDDKSLSQHTYRTGDPAGNNYAHDGLAYIGGGLFYPAPTTSDLQSMFQQISQKISTIAGHNVVVTEVLPSGVHYTNGSATHTPTNISGSGHNLTWNVGDISIGNTWTVTFDVTFDNSGDQLVDVLHSSRVDYTNYLGNSTYAEFPETHVTVWNCAPDFSNAQYNYKSVNATVAKPGDTLTFNISYKNTGNMNATGVNITDVVDTNLTNVTPQDGGSYNAGTRTITWTIGSVAVNASGTVHFTAV
ncbi:MAG: VWA domain-containing protein, partial [Dehalococcoidia bacterium]